MYASNKENAVTAAHRINNGMVIYSENEKGSRSQSCNG